MLYQSAHLASFSIANLLQWEQPIGITFKNTRQVSDDIFVRINS
jgi:hypothetical protein